MIEGELVINQGYVDVSFYTDEGGVGAYVVDTSKENLFNWLEDSGYPGLYGKLKKTYRRVAILRSMLVEEDRRGRGVGNRFVEEIITLSVDNGADAVLLVADLDEINEFNLVDWYKGWGFETLSGVNRNPLMLYELER